MGRRRNRLTNPRRFDFYLGPLPVCHPLTLLDHSRDHAKLSEVDGCSSMHGCLLRLWGTVPKPSAWVSA